MLGHKTPRPRSRARGGPSASAAQRLRQSSAQQTLLVRAPEAGRITSGRSVINKPGRSAISQQQISPKHLKRTLVPHSGSLRAVDPLQHVARRPSCSTGLTTTAIVLSLPVPLLPVLLPSVTGAWQCPAPPFDTIIPSSLGVFKSSLLLLQGSAERRPLHNSPLAPHRLEEGCQRLEGRG